MEKDSKDAGESTSEENSAAHLRNTSVGLLTAVFAFLIASWSIQQPEDSTRGAFRIAGLSFLSFSLIFAFLASIITILWKGVQRSDGPSEEMHFQMLWIAIGAFVLGFFCVSASISYIAAIAAVLSIVLGYMYLQGFIGAILSEHASPPYGFEGSKTLRCWRPYLIITKCRAKPGGPLFREWVEFKNYWAYSTPIDQLRVVLKYRQEEREYWTGSGEEVLRRFGVV